MAKYIKTMVDANGDTIYPRTRANAVTMSDGATNLETKINSKVDKTQKVNTKALSGDVTLNAVDIPNTPAGGIAATNVQTAIDELDTEKVRRAGTSTISGVNAEAIGSGQIASGVNSFAEGANNRALGDFSHAEGYDTEASNNQAHTEGAQTFAQGQQSHAEGLGTVAYGKAQHASGKWNVIQGNPSVANPTDHAYIVGNGTDDANRSNALALQWDGKLLITDVESFDGTKHLITTDEKLKLSGIEAGAEVNNLTDVNALDLTDGGDTTLHTHDGRYYTETEVDTKDALKADKVMATNLVTNGDFSNGTTGWSAGNGTLAVTNGKALVTGTGASSSVLLIPSAGGASALLNDKVYISALVKVPTEADYVALQLYNNASTVEIPSSLGKPIVDTRVSTIYTLTADRPILRGGVRCYFPSAAIANGKIFEADNILLINLTQIFGAGLEPSKEQIDRLLSIYPNSWFNGTSELANVKQLWNEKVDRLLATNLVTNGDFSNGTTGWSMSGASTASASNIMTSTGDGTSTMFIGTHATSFVSAVGKKVYAKLKVRFRTALPNQFEFIVDGITAGTNQILVKTGLVLDTWYDMSFVATQPSDVLGFIALKTVATYSSSGVALNALIDFQYVLALDLTSIFGAGKEPTAVQMDNLLANFPNSWFNGTVELASLLNILNTKADKTQEAWITPTLLNGATNVSGYDVGYFKTSIGMVALRGRINVTQAGTSTFLLPAGYKSLRNLAFPLINISTNTVTARLVLSGGNSAEFYGTIPASYSLDGIIFKAEA